MKFCFVATFVCCFTSHCLGLRQGVTEGSGFVFVLKGEELQTTSRDVTIIFSTSPSGSWESLSSTDKVTHSYRTCWKNTANLSVLKFQVDVNSRAKMNDLDFCF